MKNRADFNGRKTSLVYLERDRSSLSSRHCRGRFALRLWRQSVDEDSCAQTGVAGRRKGGEK